MGTVFLYIMTRFPDNPIHKCEPSRNYALKVHSDGYCGKQGQPHTEEDYHAFQTWQTTLFIIWPIGIVALGILQRERKP